jgi:hypothetical protein
MLGIWTVIAVLHLFAALGIIFRAVMRMCAVYHVRWDEAMEKAGCKTDYDHANNK